jgi:NitT/TauT family transport system substrate-binding protein
MPFGMHNQSRKLKLPWQFAALFLALALCMRGATAQTLPVVNIGCVPAEELTPVVYAIKAGIFRRLGLDVQITWLTNGAAVAAAVVGGSMDFGHASAFTIITANAKGVPVKIVTPTSLYRPGYPFGILVKKDSSIRTAADLKDKTVAAVSIADFSSLFLKAWIDQGGGDSRTLKSVEMPS